MKYYSITMPKAHVGFDHKQDITFVFSAPNMFSAIDMAKRMGGVKHGKMPSRCMEITKEEYSARRKISAYTPWHK